MIRRLWLSALFLFGALALPANASQDVVTLANGRHLVIVRPQATTVSGVVLLIPGGTTKLRLGPNGETNSTNFVIRTRQQLLDAGYAVAYMDDPADLREPVQRVREIGHPVVFLSTSRGTVVAAANDNDGCRVSPPRAAAQLATAIGSGVMFVHFSSSAQLSEPCEALSPHGYLEIERPVIAAIVEWIKKSS